MNGRSSEKILDGLRVEDVQIVGNTIINSNYMFEISKLGIKTFTGFEFNNNLMISSENSDQMNTGSLVRIFFSFEAPLEFKNWVVKSNTMGTGPAIHLDYEEEGTGAKI